MSFQKLKCIGFSAVCLGFASVSSAGVWDIAIGDVVNTRVYDHGEFSMSLPVDNRGCVKIPFGETISLEGKSIGEAEKILAKEFEKLGAKAPKVNVTISYAGRRVYAIGALASSVNKNADARRGETAIPTYRKLTVLQALSALGGVSELADLDAVFVRRPGKDGKVTRIGVPLTQLLAGEAIQDIELMPEDVIVVPWRASHR